MRRFGRVWITGATSGIGLALARGYRAAGATVYASARNAERLQALAKELGVIPLPLDVRDPNALAQAIERIYAEGPLDLAILNAGGSFPEAQGTAETLFAHLELNALAPAKALDLLRPRMREHGGKIAFVGSLAGYLPLPKGYGYATSKATLIHYVAALYPELKKEGVELALINPGFVDTPLVKNNDFPMPFMLKPEEAARRIMRGLAGRRFEIAFPQRLAWPLRLLRALPLNVWVRLLVFALRRQPRA